MPRAFRTAESFAAERSTRDMLAAFLSERGYTDVKDQRQSFGQTASQTIHARDPNGASVVMWVRLCWRHDAGRAHTPTRSAAQLQARVNGVDWVASLTKRMAKEEAKGATHLLVVQRDGANITSAAAIPMGSVVPIWIKQRDASIDLIKSGRLGRRRKNHAENGASPTLWLRDDDASEVTDELWRYPGVVDLAKLSVGSVGGEPFEDAADDLPGVDPAAFGSDGGERIPRTVTGVRRDSKVRELVRQRSGGRCERISCGVSRNFVGFLDVHHILGVSNGDRVWNCVALCPNCHREAHMAPNCVEINEELLAFAKQFKHSATTSAP